MLNSEALADAEKRLDYVLDGLDDATVRELARLAMLLVVTHGDTLSPPTRRSITDTLAALAPEYLLVFRALHLQVRRAIRTKRNWRSRA